MREGNAGAGGVGHDLSTMRSTKEVPNRRLHFTVRKWINTSLQSRSDAAMSSVRDVVLPMCYPRATLRRHNISQSPVRSAAEGDQRCRAPVGHTHPCDRIRAFSRMKGRPFPKSVRGGNGLRDILHQRSRTALPRVLKTGSSPDVVREDGWLTEDRGLSALKKYTSVSPSPPFTRALSCRPPRNLPAGRAEAH